ncbi:MAG: hypothetical protein AAFW73_15775 [Bacteroidota bacterium]
MLTLESFFLMVCILSLYFAYRGNGNNHRLLLSFVAWGALLGWIASTGFFQQTDTLPPRPLLAVVPPTLLLIYFYRNQAPSPLALPWLLAIHTVRVPVELILHQLYLRGDVPRLMTFVGWNYDILVGLSVILILLYYWWQGALPSRRFLLVWNGFGLLFLGIIVSLAVLSIPSPFQQLAFEQANRAVLIFPFTLLPGIIVPLVLLSHLRIFQLLREPET